VQPLKVVLVSRRSGGSVRCSLKHETWKISSTRNGDNVFICLVVWKCLEHLDTFGLFFHVLGIIVPTSKWYRHGVTIPEMGTLPAVTGWAARNVRGLPQDRHGAERVFMSPAISGRE